MPQEYSNFEFFPYDFGPPYYYYNNLKSKYKDNVSLFYMDTDSFILEIKTRGYD